MTQTLKLEHRDDHYGRRELMTFRDEGRIPGVIYGKGFESQTVFVNSHNFVQKVKEKGVLFEVEWKGQTYMVNVDSIQRDPVTHKMWHISLHKLERNAEVTIDLPVVLDGEAAGVKVGGVVQLVEDRMTVKGRPDAMPEALHIDVSALEVGHKLHISDIKFPKGVKPWGYEAEYVVATCHYAHVESIEEAAAPAVSPAEVPVVGEDDQKEAA